MYGYAYLVNSDCKINGSTDVVISSSGSAGTSNSYEKSIMKYRGIENLWGSIWQFVDGIYINNDISTNNIFVNKNSNTYSNYDSNDYYYIGYNIHKNL